MSVNCGPVKDADDFLAEEDCLSLCCNVSW